jgi:signal transduction histidine kinase
VLRNLALRFSFFWLLLVLFGFAIVFFTARRILAHVREITEAASRIGHSDLKARVPTTNRHHEVGHLALTLNRMLDRIESSMRQLHTVTDSLAHDLRSPLTAIRGKLERSLSSVTQIEQAEPIVSVIEELDRLTDFLNKSLDVAEAKADAALIHRMVANLFDNELKHLPSACAIDLRLGAQDDLAAFILEDNGPGFDSEVLPHLFERRIKGRDSNGHGLGLAFVDAVARAHGGVVSASNRESGGARIEVKFPLASS